MAADATQVAPSQLVAHLHHADVTVPLQHVAHLHHVADVLLLLQVAVHQLLQSTRRCQFSRECQ